jgi:hypothetical protein
MFILKMIKMNLKNSFYLSRYFFLVYHNYILLMNELFFITYDELCCSNDCRLGISIIGVYVLLLSI